MRAALACALAWFAAVAVAQQEPGPQYMLRYQRVYASDGLCILVREDGAFHLEKDSARQSTPYEGNLTAEQLDALKRIITDPELRSLRQTDINSDMIVNEVEAIQLAINDAMGWHELTFPTSGTIRAHRKALEPLVKWAQSVAKAKLSRLPNAAASRCMPGKTTTTTVTTVGAVPAAAPAVAAVEEPAQKPFVLRFERDHVYRDTADRQCVVLYPDGRYHFEDRVQEFQGKPRTRVYEGAVPTTAFEQARSLIEAPDLVSAKTPEAKQEWMREGEVLRVTIPRAHEVQNLAFVRFLGVASFGSRANESGGRSGLRYVIADDKVLDPLRSWIKDNIEKKKDKPIAGADGNDCTPAHWTTGR